MSQPSSPALSIIITNYNYGRFLRDAIDSALAQPGDQNEVIVVDDGSSDHSPQIIRSYGSRITAVFKENGGQNSAFNAGWAAAQGEVISFLDADDAWLPNAMAEVLPFFRQPSVAKAHWPLWIMDAQGQKTGSMRPGYALDEGDLRGLLLREGPDGPKLAPTSGNAWSREFLAQVFPLPEAEKRFGVRSASADAYLSMLAPLFGEVRRLAEPQGYYRIHGANDYSCMDFDRRLKRDVAMFEYRTEVLLDYCRRLGITVDPSAWPEHSWFHKLQRAIKTLRDHIPEGVKFLLIDDATWQWTGDSKRKAVPFIEDHGRYAGPPDNDETAIAELERMSSAGASFLVLTWVSFWWIDAYPRFFEYIRQTAVTTFSSSELVIFEFRPSSNPLT